MKLQDWCEENGVAPRWLESENRSVLVTLRNPILPGHTVGEGCADIGLWHLEDYRIVGFGRSGDGSRTSAVLERVGIPEGSFLGLLAEIEEVITANARQRAREYEEMYGFPPRVRYIEKQRSGKGLGSRSHPESGRSVYKLGPRNNGNPRANPTEAVSLMNTSYFHLLIPMLQDQHFLV